MTNDTHARARAEDGISAELLQRGRQALADAIDLVDRVDELHNRIVAGWTELDAAIREDYEAAHEWNDASGFMEANFVLIAVGDNIRHLTHSVCSRMVAGRSGDALRDLFADKLAAPTSAAYDMEPGHGLHVLKTLNGSVRQEMARLLDIAHVVQGASRTYDRLVTTVEVLCQGADGLQNPECDASNELRAATGVEDLCSVLSDFHAWLSIATGEDEVAECTTTHQMRRRFEEYLDR